MPLFTNTHLRFISLSISISIIIGYTQHWNPFIMLLTYALSNKCIHLMTQIYCTPFIKGDKNKPKHLVIVVTGWMGHYVPFKPLQQRFKEYAEQHPQITDGLMVHLAQANSNGLLTFAAHKTNQGIGIGAKRIFEEITYILDKCPSINKISFIGCSLGGLYSRYCLKLLFSDSSKYAHVQKMNFITMATPHCGVDDWLKMEFINFCGFKCSMYELSKYVIWSGIYSPTIRELALLDKERLLHRMAQNKEFAKPLKSFCVCMCFGNGKYDKLVSCNSALLLNNAKDKEIGSKVYEKMMIGQKEVFIKEIGKGEIEYENECKSVFTGLEDVQWKKFIVCWNKEKYGRIIHKQTAIVKNPLFDEIIKHFKF